MEKRQPSLVDVLTAIVGHADLAQTRRNAKAVQRDLARIANLLPLLQRILHHDSPTCPLCGSPRQDNKPFTHTGRMSQPT